jgi:hypothetical protein
MIRPAIQSIIDPVALTIQTVINTITLLVKPRCPGIMTCRLGSIRSLVQAIINAVALTIKPVLDTITLLVKPVTFPFTPVIRTPCRDSHAQNQTPCYQNNLFHCRLLSVDEPLNNLVYNIKRSSKESVDKKRIILADKSPTWYICTIDDKPVAQNKDLLVPYSSTSCSFYPKIIFSKPGTE